MLREFEQAVRDLEGRKRATSCVWHHEEWVALATATLTAKARRVEARPGKRPTIGVKRSGCPVFRIKLLRPRTSTRSRTSLAPPRQGVGKTKVAPCMGTSKWTYFTRTNTPEKCHEALARQLGLIPTKFKNPCLRVGEGCEIGGRPPWIPRNGGARLAREAGAATREAISARRTLQRHALCPTTLSTDAPSISKRANPAAPPLARQALARTTRGTGDLPLCISLWVSGEMQRVLPPPSARVARP